MSKDRIENNEEPESGRAASGVEALIRRLRDQGVEAGRAEAEKLVGEADRQAKRIAAKARAEADEIVSQAREEAERFRRSGEDALRVAGRDMVIQLREDLRHFLQVRLHRLVSDQLEDTELLRRLIVEIVARAVGDAGIDKAARIEILLPSTVVGIEELREHPEKLHDQLGQLARQIAGATWREGVVFKELQPGASGLRVRLSDKDVEVDLGEDAIADLLMQHLQPRFRAVMEGVVQ